MCRKVAFPTKRAGTNIANEIFYVEMDLQVIDQTKVSWTSILTVTTRVDPVFVNTDMI